MNSKKHIKISPYNHDWPAMYDLESTKIKDAIGDNLFEIHHIGSTSVPGLSAKPIIDIIALVEDFKIVIPLLESIGFEYRGEMHLPFRAYFRKGKELNLHLYEKFSPEVALNLRFRNYLGNHPESVQEYILLKNQLLRDEASLVKNNANYTNYNLGKDAFIRDILNKAGFDQIRLMYTNHHHEWEQYHRIRREQIFNRNDIVYDPNHPTMTDANHFHFVLYRGTEIVSVAHIELLNETDAALRSLATDEPRKHKGYGREMMMMLEKWAKSKGKSVIKMHAALDAENFYHKLGYAEIEFNDPSISKDIIDLGKELR